MAEQKKKVFLFSYVFIFLLTLVPNAHIGTHRDAHTKAVQVRTPLKWRHATFRIYVHENIDKMAQRIFHEHSETFEKFFIFSPSLRYIEMAARWGAKGSGRRPDFQYRKSSTYFNALTANITMKYAIYKVWHRSVYSVPKHIAKRERIERNESKWNGMVKRILRRKFLQTLRKYTVHK